MESQTATSTQPTETKQEYRKIEFGEVIQKGDEYFSSIKGWVTCRNPGNELVNYVSEFRRPIEAEPNATSGYIQTIGFRNISEDEYNRLIRAEREREFLYGAVSAIQDKLNEAGISHDVNDLDDELAKLHEEYRPKTFVESSEQFTAAKLPEVGML